MLHRRHILAAGALLAARPVQAKTFPQRPLRLVVSSAPGASLDALARILAPTLSARLGQPVLVENQGGANGLLAAQQVARAEPDGHTLLLTGDAIILAALAEPRAGISFESFAPVIHAVRAAQILVTHPGTGIRDMAGYLTAMRARPGGLNVGIAAQAGIAQVVHELLTARLGDLRVEFVSYRGGGPAATDLIARNTDAVVITLPAVTEYIRQGTMVPLGVSTGARDPALPEVTTFAETVAPGFDVDSWQGILAPVRTPPAIVAALHQGVAATLADPAVADRLRGLGFTITALPPQEFAARAAASSAQAAPVIRAIAERSPRG
ncbi:tripartite tricarboxylate transporter substrate binding protein [Roseococcus sp. SYP-B2431]|uniref:tripartite tricarboxylate transporter substrate binding protein n=1 Tax=Roseococcus sp. SYP-B2431 TaxID=2496640 RepID=UPI00103D1898|nr:tripartite tricarboxylate transporter substrate binding protein [Roseococcus sp. SYP-B2431]TCH99507.1 tripartite tricarboxylate transporter substrate binding protein [Roseococcus sp. SYP-B2431]